MPEPWSAAERRAVELAAVAFYAAMDDDWDAARAILAFCDTCIARQQVAGAPVVIRPKWVNMETGHVDTDASGVPPEIAWSGQILVARAGDDEAMFNALIGAIPATPEGPGKYVMALLRMTAMTTRHFVEAGQ